MAGGKYNGNKFSPNWGDQEYDYPLRPSFGPYANSLETPADHRSPHNILNSLHYDCLRAIFESLLVKDLCTLISTCKHFKRIAYDVFLAQA